MNKNKIIISILIGVLIILSAIFMKDTNRTQIPIRLENNLELFVDKLPEEYKNLQIKMLTNYSIPSSQINMTKILDNQKEKTVIAFWISGIDNIGDVFESLSIYESRNEKKSHIEILNKDKDNIYVIAICEGYVDFGTMFVTMNIKDPVLEKTLTLEGTVLNEKQNKKKDILIGDIFYVMDENFWYRLENEELKISDKKKDKKGVFYECEKTLNFFTFGYYTNIDTKKLQLQTELSYNYDINYKIYEINEQKQEYKRQNTTGYKQISITFKIYTDKLTEDIIKDIENSIIKYEDKNIFLKN